MGVPGQSNVVACRLSLVGSQVLLLAACCSRFGLADDLLVLFPVAAPHWADARTPLPFLLTTPVPLPFLDSRVSRSVAVPLRSVLSLALNCDRHAHLARVGLLNVVLHTNIKMTSFSAKKSIIHLSIALY